MRNGYVYFIGNDHGYLKIGFTSKNPFARLRELQTGCPFYLFVSTFVRATDEDERRLHETFDFLHCRGEWFVDDLKLRDFVDYLTCFGEHLETECPRERFEGAIWDVLISGYEYPDRENLSIYKRSAAAHHWTHIFPEAAG